MLVRRRKTIRQLKLDFFFLYRQNDPINQTLNIIILKISFNQTRHLLLNNK